MLAASQSDTPTTDSTKMMIMSNAPWAPTGYGTQTKALTAALHKAGHRPAVFSNYGLNGANLSVGPIRIYAAYQDQFGQDVLEAHMDNHGTDILITLMDVWVAPWLSQKCLSGAFRWYPWFPIDHDPVPAVVLEAITGCTRPLVYSNFAHEQMMQAGWEDTLYIPHAIDTSVYAPGDQAEARQAIGLPEDAFIIGLVAANKGYPDRKAFAEQFIAFADFKEVNPNAFLYVHTITDRSMGGIDLAQVADALGISDAVVFSNNYSVVNGWPTERMVKLYRSFDFLTLCSSGEGFGLPLLEAQACGIPVVTCDWTSMTELRFAGELIPKDALHPMWTPMNSWSVRPHPEAIFNAYRTLHQRLQDSDKRKSLSAQARAGAESYDLNKVVAAYWLPFIQSISKTPSELQSQEATTIQE